MTSNWVHPSTLRSFLRSETAGGLLLIAVAACALVLANAGTGGAQLYRLFVHMEIGPTLTPKLGPMTIQLWINDGLMAFFFLLVGLEIKREFADGRLSGRSQRQLPIIAAAAGMAGPAIIYLLIAGDTPGIARGWAVPAATDIAFALGVLGLLGSRAPTSLKLLLTTIAIVDDIGAVAIIALFYSDGLNLPALAGAVAVFALMAGLNRAGVKSLTVYLLLFLLLWYTILLSGVHATIAGVLAAMTIPIRKTPGDPDAPDSPLHRLENRLHPWSAYAIVPLFGFVNAGVTLKGLAPDVLTSPLPLAIAAGLLLGKQIGIFASIWACIRSGIAPMPRGATWLQIYGLSLLCGVGFTMSLFIGALAFPGSGPLQEEAKIGILTGSVLSAMAGYAILRFAPLHPHHAAIEREQDEEIEIDGDVVS